MQQVFHKCRVVLQARQEHFLFDAPFFPKIVIGARMVDASTNHFKHRAHHMRTFSLHRNRRAAIALTRFRFFAHHASSSRSRMRCVFSQHQKTPCFQPYSDSAIADASFGA